MGRLPSLTALRTFEAAARLLSFTRAAIELHVSQGAVSHQIRLLERELGTVLFHRSARRVTLTDTGRSLAERLSEAFRILASAVEATHAGRDPNEVRAVFPPNLSARWLVPRLARFHELHPDVVLTLRHGMRPEEVESEIDLAVSWSTVSPTDRAERLMGLSYAPMCSPKLKADFTLDSFDRLSACPLFGSQDWSWAEWFAKAGFPQRTIKPYATIDNANVLINAVLDGQGIGLCPTAYVADHLAEGRLVQLSDIAIYSRESFYLAHSKRSLDRSAVRMFRSWLLKQVELR
jgi:LysR family glycine cleavage system transcriptional activator